LKRSVKKTFIIALILAGAVAASAVSIRALIVERVTLELKSKGIEDLSLQLGWPSLNSITASDIAFNFRNADKLLRIEIKSGTLDYDFLQRTRMLKRLQLSDVRMSIPVSKESFQLKIPNITLAPADNLKWVTVSPTKVYFNISDAPIAISDGNATIQLLDDGGVAVLAGFVRFLGAKVALHSAVNWYPKKSFSIPISLTGLDIEQVLKIYGRPELAATGVFSGLFTARFSPAGFKSGSGALDAASMGGTIKYKSETLAQQEESSISLTQLALQDFRYSQAHVSISLAANGDMVFELNFTGNNPALQNGRNIKLKLNVEDNITKLMQSLRYTR